MLDYIKGEVTDLSPASLVLELNGIGYYIHISVNSYSQLQGAKTCKIFIHQVIREDSHTLFGFTSVDERNVFRQLISVSGIGANTARMILSSMSADEVKHAISQGNVDVLKSVKGIGAKSAQRIIIDLKDKMDELTENTQIIIPTGNTMKKEALSALDILGFSKKQAEKVVDKLLIGNSAVTVEELIKQSLKLL